MSGKYEPLSEYLVTLAGDEVCFTFTEIEAILGAPLPQTAWQRSMWWANSLRSDHPQSRAWLRSGWTVSADVNNGAVTFFRGDAESATEKRRYHWHAPRPTQYTTKVSIAVSRELKHAIDDAAVDFDVTTSDLIRRIMEEWLERHRKKSARLRKERGGTRTYRRRVKITDE
ncbi:MAG: hypothetical protein M3Y58_04175 [Chloroflexota bacterium]|nr:hypothetical protein [Chloroflexota bacterium]